MDANRLCLDFYKLLYENNNEEIDTTNKEIDTANKEIDSNNKEIDSNNKCLITGELLKDNSIKLSCGHEFNYEPLYYEIINQKINKQLDNGKLLINEIKCPYCRMITPQILPYFRYYNLHAIRGVNTPSKYSLNLYKCEYILKKNNIKCNKSACKTHCGVLCNLHFDKQSTNTGYNNLLIVELKNILRKNNCRVGGNKKNLIDRIILEKSQRDNWIE